MSVKPTTALTCMAIAALLSFSVFAATAFANEPGTPNESTARIFHSCGESVSDSLPGNDELFEGYVKARFYGEEGFSIYGNYGASHLTGANLTIYNTLKATVEKIAAGDVSSTKVIIPVSSFSSKNEWSAKELNVSSITKDNVVGLIDAKLDTIFDFDLIIDCLLADCPYEFYWYDKTKGISFASQISYNVSKAMVTYIAFSFVVMDSYKDAKATPYDGCYFNTDTVKCAKTKKAAANARAIVASYASLPDYQKLLAYKDKICSMVEYDYDAANNYSADGSTGVRYGDPWQMIYVFDNDLNTKVVCEGYTKAFQYLCDMSTFESKSTRVYLALGQMINGATSVKHMWNIVSLRGANYIADITNCDKGTIGESGALFLAGSKKGTVSESGSTLLSATVSAVSGKLAKPVTYIFDSHTEHLYNGTAVLSLSAANYAVSAWDITVKASDVTLTYGNTAKPVSVMATAPSGAGTPVYKWYLGGKQVSNKSSFTLPSDLVAGKYVYTCDVSLKGDERKKSVSVTVTVNKAPISSAGMSLSRTSMTYTGSKLTPSVAVTLSGKPLVAGRDFKVEYAGNLNVGTATAKVTGIGNYAGTKSMAFAITRKKVTPQLVLADSIVSYNGKKRVPTLQVKAGDRVLPKSQYTVTCTNNVKPGKATLRVALKGNYSGSATTSFFVKVAAPKIALAKPAKNAITLTWVKKSAAQATGYQIAYSKKSSLSGAKKVTVKQKYSSKKITKLVSNTLYYVKMRCYKKIGAKTYYSNWSPMKVVKIR